MSFDPEMLADRRRLRRKLSLWRVLAFISAIAAVIAIGIRASGQLPFGAGSSHIARITIDGVISEDRKMTDLLKKLGETESVAAVIISIDSPGGTTTGSEALYDSIRAVGAKKPTVTYVNGLAASGGYIAALASDHIVARETSLVGSIGVLFQYPDASNLLNTIGVKVEEIKSAPLKAAPNPFQPTSPEARAALKSVVDNTFQWFKKLVTLRRTLNSEQLQAVSDGRVFTGSQGLALKLVDTIGPETKAVEWLEQEKNVAKNLKIKDWKPRKENDPLGLLSMAGSGLDVLGLSQLASLVRQVSSQTVLYDRPRLLVLWTGKD